MTLSFGSLVGARGASIAWNRFAVYFVALMISDLVFFLLEPLIHRGGVAPLWIWVIMIAGNVVQSFATLFAFRWVRSDALAALVGAAMHVVAMTLVRLLFSGALLREQMHFDWFIPLNSFLWVFLFLLGVALAVPRIKPGWLGLGVGAAAGLIAASLLGTAILPLRFGGNFSFSLSSGLADLAFDVGTAAVFAGVLWGGLLALGIRPEAEMAALPAQAPAVSGRVAELQAAANFHRVRRLLLAPGIGSMIFGVVAIVMGANSIQANPINAGLLLIGVFLLAEGIWIVSAPTLTGIIVDGLALVTLGLWNIFVSLANIQAGSRGTPSFVAFGLLQIVWGIQSFRRYSQLSNLPMKKPDEATAKWLDQTIKGLTASKAPAPDLIDFQAKTSKRNKGTTWKARLLPDLALFAGPEEEVIVADRSETSITPLGTPGPVGVEAQFQLGGRSFSGIIAQDSLEKFMRWKSVSQ
jgi:hypothetical protein